MVATAQGVKHRQPDLLARHFRPFQPQALVYLRRNLLENGDGDRSVLDGRLHTSDYLRPLEGLTLARTFDDHERHLVQALVGRETPATRKALPPASDGGSLLGRARINDPVFES